ncbi:MAG: hypothetical protein WCJ84_06280 [Candidatus Peregrinibacteria bacterium]
MNIRYFLFLGIGILSSGFVIWGISSSHTLSFAGHGDPQKIEQLEERGLITPVKALDKEIVSMKAMETISKKAKGRAKKPVSKTSSVSFVSKKKSSPDIKSIEKTSVSSTPSPYLQ